MPARPVALLSLAALAIALPAAPLRAQSVVDTSATTPAPPTALVSAAGPTLQSLSVAARLHSVPVSASEQRAMQARNAGLGRAQAMMIVGGAAILVGAIIGDDPGTVLMVGGAVVGLYGLYKYLQ